MKSIPVREALFNTLLSVHGRRALGGFAQVSPDMGSLQFSR